MERIDREIKERLEGRHCATLILLLNIRESVYRDTITKVTNKMQLYGLIYFSFSALHVSGNVIAHHQEQ
jgi:hypothetical protein